MVRILRNYSTKLAFDKCSLELMNQMLQENTQIQKTNEFIAEITLTRSHLVEECANFMSHNKYGLKKTFSFGIEENPYIIKSRIFNSNLYCEIK